ncbi:MAG: hypothetical protein ACK55Z_26385, partial [bacterium]
MLVRKWELLCPKALPPRQEACLSCLEGPRSVVSDIPLLSVPRAVLSSKSKSGDNSNSHFGALFRDERRWGVPNSEDDDESGASWCD